MRYTRYFALLISLLVATACFVDDAEQPAGIISEDCGTVTIAGRITGYDDCYVDTRVGKTNEESYSSSMAMAIFPISTSSTPTLGDCISYVHLMGNNVNFTVDRTKLRELYGDQYDNMSFALYLFANMPHLPLTMSELEDRSLDYFMTLAFANNGNNAIGRPQQGFPMIGSLGDITKGQDEFILIPTQGEGNSFKIKLPTLGGTPSDYIPIPLKALYAKISFNITVEPTQHMDTGTAPSFTLTEYTLHNVPSEVYADAMLNKDHANILPPTYTSVNKSVTEGGTLNFDFYLPERLLTPATSAEQFKYPLGENNTDITGYSNVRDEDKKYCQRFKGDLVEESQCATYITLHGLYLDHQDNSWEVTYTIYLGEDNYGNFDFKRNTNYINYVTIRGLTSYSDANSSGKGPFIDHRVNVKRSLPIIVNLQRETLLDSHFEVRPLRVRYPIATGSNAQVKVEILNIDGTTNDIPGWVRMEHNNGTGSTTSTHLASGKRKYFTTDLVTNTLRGNTLITRNLAANSNEVFWIYIDQCDEVAPLSNKNKMRKAMVKVSYLENGAVKGEPLEYILCQHLLYPVQTTRTTNDVNGTDVSTGTYTYYIEYEEEYLHNYDSEDDHGISEQGGMEWGLNGIQLSHLDEAIAIKAEATGWETLLQWLGWSKQDIVDEAIGKLSPKPYYDFYLVRDVISTTPITPYAYNGLDFNTKMISYLKSQNPSHQSEGASTSKTAKVEKIYLDEKPNSAIAYCYNRNKRNSNGEVVSQDWYLPAIDEIEDIMENAYGDFDTEFQGNMYWSCQPSYLRYSVMWYFDLWSGSNSAEGVYFLDNPNRARATKALRENNNFVGVPNSGDMTYATQDITIKKPFLGSTSITVSSAVLNSNYDTSYRDYEGNLPRSGGTKARVRCVRKHEGVTTN